MNRIARLLFTTGLAAIPLASFLTFLSQPLIGRAMLPIYGGQAVVWLTVMLFFQATLFAGYLFAGYLERVSHKLQGYTVISLVVIACILLQMPPQAEPSKFSYIGLFSLLSFRIFPAILLTTSFSIIMHGWARARGGAIPYYLYSISNIGSLIALGCYPIFLEPSFGIAQLSEVWTILFWTLSLAVIAAALGFLSTTKERTDQATTSAEETPEIIDRVAKAGWILLPAISTALMLIVTQELTHELGANPISWVPPFFLFLLVYTIVFTGRLAPSLIIWWWSLGVLAYSVYFLQPDDILKLLPHRMSILLVAQAFFTLALTHTLYELRPLKRYGLFYTYSALGGVIGGVLCAIVFPLIFQAEIEIHLLTILLLILFGYHLVKELAHPLTILLLAVIAILFGLPLSNKLKHKESEAHFRSFYGALKVVAGNKILKLAHGPVQHGSQFVEPEKSLTPTAYYTESSVVGKLIRTLQAEHESIHIGAIGLGSGTLAAYLRPEDKITFWEIDPLAKKIATQIFTFCEESPGEVDIIIEDGRIGISNFPDKLDLVIVDAFSGDGIPIHLLTQEALQAYAAVTHNGLVALHVSNKHLLVGRVAQSTAESLGYDTMAVIGRPSPKTSQEANALGSVYMLYTESQNASLYDTIKKQLDDDNRQQETYIDEAPDPTLIWTDDHHAVWPIFNWKGFLK